MTRSLDPMTLRTVADEFAEQADHRARCCGGAHVTCAVRIATLSEMSTGLRARALDVELAASGDGAVAS